MRVLHCCLANFYIDDAGYQENILPKYHARDGHTVEIVASTETYLDDRSLGYVEPACYQNRDGIKVTRIGYTKALPHFLVRKLRIYPSLSQELRRFRPDVIFLHDCQFLSVHAVARYAQEQPETTIYVDGHTDFINSARTWASKHLLHGVLYKYCAKVIEPYVRKFYGVLPLRSDFFRDVYGIDPAKIELLPLGADDSNIAFERRDDVRREVREGLNIREEDFLIVTGGRFDGRKCLSELAQAVGDLGNDTSVRLLVFGAPTKEMESAFEKACRGPRVSSVGWVEVDRIYDLFLASDLGVFPGTHSVLWEQAVGSGLPCLFRGWDGIKHLDVGGNCMFLESSDSQSIAGAIREIQGDPGRYAAMRRVAWETGRRTFSYSDIARRAIS